MKIASQISTQRPALFKSPPGGPQAPEDDVMELVRPTPKDLFSKAATVAGVSLASGAAGWGLTALGRYLGGTQGGVIGGAVAVGGALWAASTFPGGPTPEVLIGTAGAAALGSGLTLLGVSNLLTAGGLALTAAGSAGATYKRFDEPYSMGLKLDPYAEKFVEVVQDNLPAQATAQLSGSTADNTARQAAVAAYRLALEHMPPAAAAALTEIPATLLMGEDEKRRASDFSGKDFVVAGPNDPETHRANLIAKDLNVPIEVVEKGTFGPAEASPGLVRMDKRFIAGASNNTVALVLGHEKSHLDHGDPVARRGKLAMLRILEEQGETELYQGLMENFFHECREDEFRCDHEGATTMLQNGYQPEDILEGAREIFTGDETEVDPEDLHPPNVERRRRLEQFAKDHS